MNKANILGFLGVLVFLTSAAFANISQFNGYDLKMKLSVNGKIISAPHILTKAGETTTITQKTEDEESFVEVTAIDGSILGTEGIMMTFVVGTIDKDGQRTITSRPQIFAKENKQSKVTVEQDGRNEILLLSVVAKRKSL